MTPYTGAMPQRTTMVTTPRSHELAKVQLFLVIAGLRDPLNPSHPWTRPIRCHPCLVPASEYVLVPLQYQTMGYDHHRTIKFLVSRSCLASSPLAPTITGSPVIQSFKDHLLSRLMNYDDDEHVFSSEERATLQFVNNLNNVLRPKRFEATTTYDMRCDQDTLHPGHGFIHNATLAGGWSKMLILSEILRDEWKCSGSAGLEFLPEYHWGLQESFDFLDPSRSHRDFTPFRSLSCSGKQQRR
ncbi:hypothetical protein HD554DRAFT_266417 [Boletus coccyginus]|nr:hypothetical protein HD554DRAFT_266417 [Boletus coccyginus]